MSELLGSLPAGLAEADVTEACARSLFLCQTLERYPEQVQAAVKARALAEPTTEAWLQQRWGDFLATVDSEPSLHAALREYRREIQFRIIMRDVVQWAHLIDTLLATLPFADVAVDARLSRLSEHRWDYC